MISTILLSVGAAPPSNISAKGAANAASGRLMVGQPAIRTLRYWTGDSPAAGTSPDVSKKSLNRALTELPGAGGQGPAVPGACWAIKTASTVGAGAGRNGIRPCCATTVQKTIRSWRPSIFSGRHDGTPFLPGPPTCRGGLRGGRRASPIPSRRVFDSAGRIRRKVSNRRGPRAGFDVCQRDTPIGGPAMLRWEFRSKLEARHCPDPGAGAWRPTPA